MGRGVSKSGAGGGGNSRSARNRSGGSKINLPGLEGTGSEKQVKWANDIRNDAYNQLDRLDGEVERFKGFLADTSLPFNHADVQEVRTQITKTLTDPRAANARFVIDHRRDLSPGNISNIVNQIGMQRKILQSRKNRK